MKEKIDKEFQDLEVSLENLFYQIDHQMKVYDNLCISGLSCIGIKVEDKKEMEFYPFFLHQMKICEYFKNDIKKILDETFKLEELLKKGNYNETTNKNIVNTNNIL